MLSIKVLQNFAPDQERHGSCDGAMQRVSGVFRVLSGRDGIGGDNRVSGGSCKAN
jgi:hypothetical protein